MSNLFIIMGAPGSGKSTYLKHHANGKVISRDTIRFSLLGENDDYFSKEDEVYHTFIKEICKSLEENENTYVDATHLNKRSRYKLYSAIGLNLLEKTYVTIIYVNVPLEICLERNAKREGRAKVPEKELISMYGALEKPNLNTEPVDEFIEVREFVEVK